MTQVHPHHEHDWLSESYVQSWIANDVTRDGERRPKLRRAAASLPLARDSEVRVLDIGGGYGELSAQVLEEFPNSVVVLQDYSEPMLAAARERLAGYGDRVELRRSDLTEPGWSMALGGPFDAAVSAIAIHNLRKPLRKPELIHAVYNEVATVIADGGAFLNLDYIFPSTPLLRALYAGDGQQGGHSGGGGPAPAEAANLENQLRWLAEGFTESDCIWKDGREALLCGLK